MAGSSPEEKGEEEEEEEVVVEVAVGARSLLSFANFDSSPLDY